MFDFLKGVIGYLPELLAAVPVVIGLALGAMALALVLGLLLALMRLSPVRLFRGVALTFVEVIRGTPLLVQLVYIYFVLPVVGINISPVPAGILGLGLNYAAYLSEVYRSAILSVERGQTEAALSEVYRSAILSVERGQTEAALSLGYTPGAALFRVVIPQSFTVALGPIGNYFIAMIKDTALTSVIAVSEILKTANNLNSQTFDTTTVYTAAALLYLVMSLPLSRLVVILERRARRNE